jgi:hypothetical protein
LSAWAKNISRSCPTSGRTGGRDNDDSYGSSGRNTGSSGLGRDNDDSYGSGGRSGGLGGSDSYGSSDRDNTTTGRSGYGVSFPLASLQAAEAQLCYINSMRHVFFELWLTQYLGR